MADNGDIQLVKLQNSLQRKLQRKLQAEIEINEIEIKQKAEQNLYMICMCARKIIAKSAVICYSSCCRKQNALEFCL